MLGPGITSCAAVLASCTQVLENADVAYLFIGPGITSCATVPASCTHVLDNNDKPYFYVRSRNYVTRGGTCITYAILRQG